MANPIGRPTLYDPDYHPKEIIEICKKGFSFEACAGHFGISKDTLYKWVKKHPEFADAKKVALEQARIFWESAAVEGLWNQKDEKSLNNTLWVFNMKNRFGWKDKIETEHKLEEKPKLVIDLGGKDDQVKKEE